MRKWSYLDGTTVQALITHWDTETGMVTLSTDDEKEIKVKLETLCFPDQGYIQQWSNYREKLDLKLKEMGGKMEFLQTTGEYKVDFYVYKPSTYKADGSAPMMILFSSSGRGYRMMLRHFEAAEKAGILLVTTDYFSNHTLDYYDQRGLKKVSEAHFRAVLPQFETLSHDPKKLYLGGDSGGALRAYMYSAVFERPWAGIYANCGWLGRDYTMQCHKGMRVAMVNGHKDIAANRSGEKDSKYLAEQRDCEVGFFSFEGGHQLAPVDAQVDAFKWLIEERAEE